MIDFLARFRKKPTKSQVADNMAVINSRIARSQEAVYQAVKELNTPSNGRRIAEKLGWDSASVTNRLAELTRKGRLRVAYRKRGLDSVWRNFYVINERYEQ